MSSKVKELSDFSAVTRMADNAAHILKLAQAAEMVYAETKMMDVVRFWDRWESPITVLNPDNPFAEIQFKSAKHTFRMGDADEALIAYISEGDTCVAVHRGTPSGLVNDVLADALPFPSMENLELDGMVFWCGNRASVRRVAKDEDIAEFSVMSSLPAELPISEFVEACRKDEVFVKKMKSLDIGFFPNRDMDEPKMAVAFSRPHFFIPGLVQISELWEITPASDFTKRLKFACAFHDIAQRITEWIKPSRQTCREFPELFGKV